MPHSAKRQEKIVDRVRSLLATRELSLMELSRQSRYRFPEGRLFRIPPNFYDFLRRPSFSPSLHQVYVLSVLTDYALADWLSVFGFSFDDAAAFQASHERYWTAELDAKLYDPHAEVSWFEETGTPALGTMLTPLSRWLTGTSERTLDSLPSKIGGSFRYLKIGSHDAYAFPDLLPGSIVRVDIRSASTSALVKDRPGHILAVESERGIVCGRIRRLSGDRIVLCSRQLAYEPAEFRLGTEARILGRVDMEIRSLESRQSPEVRPNRRRMALERAHRPTGATAHVGELLRRVRLRSGLSFREASEHTTQIARVLRDPHYSCAPGTLSDLETREGLPRHIHKLISLSAVYCLPVTELLDAAALRLAKAGREPMPAHLKYPAIREFAAAEDRPSPFLAAVEKEFEEVPFFLGRALRALCGLPNLSVRDLFWAGATGNLEHPYLRGAAFLAVNRRSKIPAPASASPTWAQPLYVLELKGGRRLCAACSLQGTTLMLRSCTTSSHEPLRLRHPNDVEVLGKVVAIVRRL